MPGTRNVLIYPDGGAAAGAGHVVRMWSLSRALAAAGCDVRFAGNEESRIMLAGLGAPVDDWLDTGPTVAADELGHQSAGCDLLVIDHYGIGIDFERRARAWATSIVVVDDAPTRPHDCDVLIDQTCGRAAQEYAAQVPAACTLLTGAEYAMLRPEFAAARLASTAARQFPPQRIFVAFGATDASRKLVPCLESLRGVDRDVAIDAVISSRAPHLEEIRQAASRLDVSLHVDSTAIAGLLGQSDVAVIAAGSVAWEACCMRALPFLLVTADNQLDVAGALSARGAAVTCETPEASGPALAKFLADKDGFARVRARAASLCDGLGARRVAMALAPEADRDGRRVVLRPATMQDAPLVLEWQAAPETRRFARNPAVPSAAEHMAWMERMLQRQDCIFSIVVAGGQLAGVVRLDRCQGAQAFEVSIFIAPGYKGCGIGAAALRLARRLMPEVDLQAQVLSDNQASHALFASAGFVQSGNWYHSVSQAGHA